MELKELKSRIRVKADTADEEIKGLVAACESDMRMRGIYGTEADPLYAQAIVLYCKANYGYDDNTERFREAYESLRDSMALSGDYSLGVMGDGG